MADLIPIPIAHTIAAEREIGIELHPVLDAKFH